MTAMSESSTPIPVLMIEVKVTKPDGEQRCCHAVIPHQSLWPEAHTYSVAAGIRELMLKVAEDYDPAVLKQLRLMIGENPE